MTYSAAGYDVQRSQYPLEESLFPVTMGDETVMDTMHRLNEVTIDDIDSFIWTGERGPIASPLLALNDSGLEQWHEETGRIKTDDDSLFYKAGLLYGVKISSDQHQQTHGGALLLDSPASYSVALDMVRKSYDDFPYDTDDGERRHQESSRELEYLGTQVLGTVDGAFYDKIYEHFGGADVDNWNDRMAAQVAFHTGLVDAGIFCNTFMRARMALPPARFPEPEANREILMPYRDLPVDDLRRIINHRFYLPLPEQTEGTEAVPAPPSWHVIWDGDDVYNVLAGQYVVDTESGPQIENKLQIVVPQENDSDYHRASVRIVQRLVSFNGSPDTDTALLARSLLPLMLSVGILNHGETPEYLQGVDKLVHEVISKPYPLETDGAE